MMPTAHSQYTTTPLGAQLYLPTDCWAKMGWGRGSDGKCRVMQQHVLYVFARGPEWLSSWLYLYFILFIFFDWKFQALCIFLKLYQNIYILLVYGLAYASTVIVHPVFF